MYEEYLKTLRETSNKNDESAALADQLLTLHNATKSRDATIFLELGTDRGQSTKVILNALHNTDGKLVSVDIRDCSNAGSGDNWTFVQSDSTDRQFIFSKAPFLEKGIDFIYVDSKHTPEHVQKEIYTYFKFVRKGGKIFFDDIDSAPYMRGRRKDNAVIEIANRNIFRVIQSIYYNNIGKLKFEAQFGSTGLAILTKTSEFGTELDPYKELTRPRSSLYLNRLLRLFKKSYRHKDDGSDFIIPIK